VPLSHAGPGLLLVHGRTNRSTTWDGAAVTGAGECGVMGHEGVCNTLLICKSNSENAAALQHKSVCSLCSLASVCVLGSAESVRHWLRRGFAGVISNSPAAATRHSPSISLSPFAFEERGSECTFASPLSSKGTLPPLLHRPLNEMQEMHSSHREAKRQLHALVGISLSHETPRREPVFNFAPRQVVLPSCRTTSMRQTEASAQRQHAHTCNSLTS
jgi:hypothetical protein